MTTRFFTRKAGFLLCALLIAGLTGASLLQSNDAKLPASGDGPQYNEKGELKRPEDFRRWVFVGANMGVEYRDDAKSKKTDKPRDEPPKVGNFHNVYMNPSAYASYAKTGTFPDGTQLVLDIYNADAGEPGSIVAAGRFPGKQTGVALAVKNSARPDGSKTVWAYYDFGLTGMTAKAFPDKACYNCHADHADEDNVWVQFYPTLRHLRDERAKGKSP